MTCMSIEHKIDSTVSHIRLAVDPPSCCETGSARIFAKFIASESDQSRIRSAVHIHLRREVTVCVNALLHVAVMKEDTSAVETVSRW